MLIRRFIKRFHRSEKGFTLLELLMVVAILGTLTTVVVPNVGGLIGTANVAAANIEAANVKTAALVHYTDNIGTWPIDSDDLVPDYLNAAPDATYTFDPYGLIASATAGTGITSELTFDATTQFWEK